MKVYSTHYQRFTPPYFKGIVCLFAALMLTVVDMKGEEWTCGNVTVTLNTSANTLTLSPKSGTNGRMSDLTRTETNWRTLSNRNHVKKIVIEDGVTYIGAYAFYYCTEITSIRIPVSVTEFGEKAFLSCNGSKKIYYAGTPNQWAQINFTLTDTYPYSHPFYNSASSTAAFYFYNQESVETTDLVFSTGIKNIKPYTFYYAKNIVNVYIPGTIESIGDAAFSFCKIQRLNINKQIPPTASEGTFIFNAGNTYLFVPCGAKTGYANKPWYDSEGNGKGAKYIGYSGDKSQTGAGCDLPLAGRYVCRTDGTCGASITWTLDEDGELTLNGSGAISTTYNETHTTDNVVPWFRFRYLVNKVVIKGGITDLSNALAFCKGIQTITIEQDNIPTGTYSITTDFRNSIDHVTLKIKPASLTDASASRLGSVPWNDAKLDIALSEPVVLADNTDNGELLEAVQTYIELPFEVAFGRTLTNAQYNTFCSPVPMSAEQITAVFGGADIRALEGSEYNAETKELTLNFSGSSLTEIEAGKPYLIKPMNETVNPHFANIAPGDIKTTPIDATTEFVDFKGVLAPTPLTGGNKNTLFLGADNELFWPASTGNLNGFRAYFEIKDASAQAAKRARISMGGKIATGIENPSPALPSREGVKILRDGKLYLMYKGQMYDVQGRRI